MRRGVGQLIPSRPGWRTYYHRVGEAGWRGGTWWVDRHTAEAGGENLTRQGLAANDGRNFSTPTSFGLAPPLPIAEIDWLFTVLYSYKFGFLAKVKFPGRRNLLIFKYY